MENSQKIHREHEVCRSYTERVVEAIEEYKKAEGVRTEEKTKKLLNAIGVPNHQEITKERNHNLLEEYIMLHLGRSELDASLDKYLHGLDEPPYPQLVGWDAIEYLTKKYAFSSKNACYQRLKRALAEYQKNRPVDEETGRKSFQGILPSNYSR